MSDEPVDLEAFKARTKGRKTGKARTPDQAPSTPPSTADDSDDRGSRLAIKLVDTRINKIARQCAEELAGEIFLRGPVPAVLVHAEEAGGSKPAANGEVEPGVVLDGVRHSKGAPVLIEPTIGLVQFRLDEKFLFKRYDVRSDEWRPKSCPPSLAQRIISAAAELGFRPLAGIVTAPLFVNGQVIASPGYHEPSGLYLAYRGRLPAIPKKPTKKQAVAALKVLLRPFRGYLRGLDGDELQRLRTAFAAAVLTAVLRPSLPTSPAILLDANTPGAGKGKAARALGVISSGRLPALIAEAFSVDEFEKRVSSALISGASVILCDNLQRQLSSSTLESGITEGVATIRLFGSLASVTVPVTALILFTGNNAGMRADMLRRVLTVRIVAKTETPENEVFDFDPYHEASDHRDEILAAAFTIARAWWQVRSNDDVAAIRKRTLGSFEEWADLVAGPVEWLTGLSPIDLIEQRKKEDPRRGDERQVFAELLRWQASRPARKGEQEASWTAKEAAQGLQPETWSGVLRMKGEAPSPREVGEWLKRRRDRVLALPPPSEVDVAAEDFTTWQLVGRPDRDGVMEWKLRGLRGLAGSVLTQGENLARDIIGIEYEENRNKPKNSCGREVTPQDPADPADEVII